MGYRAVCVSCQVELFDVYDAYYARNGEYLVYGYVERVVVVVVGHRAQAVLLVALAQTLDNKPLLACGEQVWLVPLDELRLAADDGAGYDVPGIELGDHRVACDLNHEVHAEEAELGYYVVGQHIALLDGEMLAGEASDGFFGHQRYRAGCLFRGLRERIESLLGTFVGGY